MSLTVICPNARRCKVAVTPMKLLNEVLAEACLREGYPTDKCYVLKFHNRAVDLSLPVRLSCLPSNAALEMEEVEGRMDEGEIGIALQMPDGRRITRGFTSDATLHQVLDQLTSPTTGATDAASSGAGQVPRVDGGGKVPCLTYMNKQWKGEKQMQRTTLRSMGITPGCKVLLRYSLVTMTVEELEALDAELESDAKRREALTARFVQMQRENQLSEEMQQKFSRDFDERQRLIQLAEREQRKMELQAAGTPSTSSPSAAPPHEPITQPPAGRLERLQAIYSEVNASIEENRDLRQDELDKWKYKHDILPESFDPSQLVTQLEQPDFSDFKFPDYNPSLQAATEDDAPATNSRDLGPAVAAERNAVFYRLDQSAGTADNNDSQLSDEFFDLTVEEARRMQRELREHAREYEQLSVLSSQHMAEKNRELKAQNYKNAVIRFLLPQHPVVPGTIVQAQFFSREPCSRLFEFVRDALFAGSSSSEIRLYVANTRVEDSALCTLIDADIAPKSTIIVRVSGEIAEQAVMSLATTTREVGTEEANRMSEEWLSCNSAFVSCESPSSHTQRRETGTSGSVKRGASSALNGGATVGGQPTSTNLPSSHKPKWFKK